MKLLFAHNLENFVKTGDFVKKGDKIGSIGKGYNNEYFAHLHFSVSEGLSDDELKKYVSRWSKKKVQQYFQKPDFELFQIPMDAGNLGYGWLQWFGRGYHPGIDYNAPTGGDTDLGVPFFSPVNGIVSFAGDWGKGWGNVVIVNKNEGEILSKEEFEEFKQEVNKRFDNLENPK